MKKNNFSKIFASVAVGMMMLTGAQRATAQAFDDYFTNQTLRIDYNFAGDAHEQRIAVDQLNMMPGWYGKRQRLAEVPVEGNGQIKVVARAN